MSDVRCVVRRENGWPPASAAECSIGGRPETRTEFHHRTRFHRERTRSSRNPRYRVRGALRLVRDMLVGAVAGLVLGAVVVTSWVAVIMLLTEVHW